MKTTIACTAPLWGVYTIDPSDGQPGWISLPQVPGDPILAFQREADAKAFAEMSQRDSGCKCFVGVLNPAITNN